MSRHILRVDEGAARRPVGVTRPGGAAELPLPSAPVRCGIRPSRSGWLAVAGWALLGVGCGGPDPDPTPPDCGGEIGCACDDDLACSHERVCDEDLKRCRAAVGCEDLACVLHQLCREAGDGRDAECEARCDTGYGWDAAAGRCRATCDAPERAAIAESCAEQHRRCESGETGEAWCGECLDGYELAAGACRDPVTCEMLDCAEQHRVCEPAGEGGVAGCGECLDGYLENPSSGTCENSSVEATCSELDCPTEAPCEPDSDGVLACRCLDENLEFDGVGCTPDCGDDHPPAMLFEPTGRYLCEVEPGSFYSPVDGTVLPCDADGDGWVRQSARAALEAGSAESHFNQCELRVVDAFTLIDERGVSVNIELDEPLPMYESDRNDDSELLRAALCPDAAACHVPGPRSLNRLTKICASVEADLNDNRVPDLDEWGGMPASPEDASWNRFGYFTELHDGWFVPAASSSESRSQRGSYVIRERARSEIDVATADADELADHVAIVDGSDSGYWRHCTVLPDAQRAQYAEPVGMDFADIQPEDAPEAWRGLNHHSQFKCLVAKAQPLAEHPQQVDLFGQGAVAHFTRNACQLAGEASPVDGADSVNPTRPAFECRTVAPGAYELSDRTVFWAAVGYHDYLAEAGHVGYVRGCVNACAEARTDHERVRDRQGLSGFLSSLEERWGCHYAAGYRDTIACHADRNGALVCDEACSDEEDNDRNGLRDLADYYVWPVPNHPDDWPPPYDPAAEDPGRARMGEDCPTGIGEGACAVGMLECRNGLPFCRQPDADRLAATPEICNGKDDNCNDRSDREEPVDLVGESCDPSAFSDRVCVESCEPGQGGDEAENEEPVPGSVLPVHPLADTTDCRYLCTDPDPELPPPLPPVGECAKYGQWECRDTRLGLGLECVSTFNREENDTECNGLDTDCDGVPDTGEGYYWTGDACRPTYFLDDHHEPQPLTTDQQAAGICVEQGGAERCMEHGPRDARVTGRVCVLAGPLSFADESEKLRCDDDDALCPPDPLCDGHDNDCDGSVDETDTVGNDGLCAGSVTWHLESAVRVADDFPPGGPISLTLNASLTNDGSELDLMIQPISNVMASDGERAERYWFDSENWVVEVGPLSSLVEVEIPSCDSIMDTSPSGELRVNPCSSDTCFDPDETTPGDSALALRECHWSSEGDCQRCTMPLPPGAAGSSGTGGTGSTGNTGGTGGTVVCPDLLCSNLGACQEDEICRRGSTGFEVACPCVPVWTARDNYFRDGDDAQCTLVTADQVTTISCDGTIDFRVRARDRD